MDLRYQTGFGSYFETEAHPGALPVGQNSPQKVPSPLAQDKLVSVFGGPVTPNRLRWDPLEIPTTPTDFVDGLVTLAGNAEAATLSGIGVHNRVFYDADGELLIVPQQGVLTLVTELGVLAVGPRHIAVIPRGVRFRVEVDGPSRGYVCENYGAAFRLPELGPDRRERPGQSPRLRDARRGVRGRRRADGGDPEVPRRALGGEVGPQPAGRRRLARQSTRRTAMTCRRFNTINTVSYDHPDPSIFTVLTSPSDTPGTANCDFVIFPPRWMVAQRHLPARPASSWGWCTGAYDAKEGGFVPGGASLHNCMSDHGPDVASHRKATEAELTPHKIDGTLAFMFESRWVIRPTKFALETSALQDNYDACWTGFPKARLP
ncbi:Homogentisate 1,2-dioxygenase [Aphelenchoides fujianensis]|nr:Homogentisate 1,2-dioxygenase [Aphelenchoides fujianensis]